MVGRVVASGEPSSAPLYQENPTLFEAGAVGSDLQWLGMVGGVEILLAVV